MNVDKRKVTSIFHHPKGAANAEAAAVREANEPPLALGTAERKFLVEEARRIYQRGRCRNGYFPGNLFGEPAWDLLLMLYIEAGERPLTATGAAQVTDTPETTASRWVYTLESAGLINSHSHASDRRLRLLALSTYGRAMMDQYLTDILHS